MYTCTKCKQTKDASLFHKYKAKKNGLTSQCKACRNLARFKWGEEYKERSKKRRKERYNFLKENDPSFLWLQNRNYKLKKAYNITHEEYMEMLKSQDYKCLVCGKEHQEADKKRLVVDHCHNTNKIRGLLCNNCNTALGLLYENTSIIESLKSYVLSHNQS
jgi:hypothetical protein